MNAVQLHREGVTALKFAAVSGLGFLTDITVLHLALHALGLTPFQARAISLTCAMQATFVVNGLVVFRCLSWARWPRQWLTYMLTNGLGNLINYLVFAGLILSRLPQVSRNGWALVIGSVIAYGFNFSCARLMVFGRPRPRRGTAAPPSHPMCAE